MTDTRKHKINFAPASKDKSSSSSPLDYLTGMYLSSLQYFARDEFNGGKRTILINENPKWCIILKKKKYYAQKAIENFVFECCNKNDVDYLGEDTVRNCVKEIIFDVNNKGGGGGSNAGSVNRDPDHQVLSVSDAIRRHSGPVTTLGRIIGVSKPDKVIISILWSCTRCGYQKVEEMDPPVSYFNPQNHRKCPQCSFSSGNGKGEAKKTIKQKQKQNDLYDQSDLTPEPGYENSKSINIQDSEASDDLESLHVVLLGDEITRNVKVGEMASIKGEIYTLGGSGTGGKNDVGKKLFPILFSHKIIYQREEETPISEDEIELFKQFAGKDDVIQQLVEMFAPNVIGHSDTKLGILRSAVSTKSNYHSIIDSQYSGGRRNNSTAAVTNIIAKIRNRINTLLVGDPGTAKTMLAEEATKIVPNSRYVTVQHASVKSLLAIIDKEEYNKTLLLGAIPMSKNALCVINEVGSMVYEDQQYLADVMEEGKFTIDKYGIYQEIQSPTTILATTNPHGGRWDNFNGPSINQIPVKSNILDRIDQIYVFQDFQTDEDKLGYADVKMAMNQNGLAYDYDFLKRYLQYAASIDEPVLTTEATTMFKFFWLKLSGMGNATNRTLDSIFRIAIAQARLHLKKEIDVQIANETIESIGLMFAALGNRIDTSENDPRDLVYNEIIRYVNNTLAPNTQITFVEAAKYAAANSHAVRQYIGNGTMTISDNKRLRGVHDRFTDGGTDKPKVSKDGKLAVLISRMTPLTLVKVDLKQWHEQQQHNTSQQEEEQEQVSQENNNNADSNNANNNNDQKHEEKESTTDEKGERSNRSFRSFSDTVTKESNSIMSENDLYDLYDLPPFSKLHDNDVSEVIKNAMLDEQGNNKGYFILDDLVFHMLMLPNQKWTHNEAQQLVSQLVKEGKLKEMEPGRKYKPVTKELSDSGGGGGL